jgi:transposase
MRVMESNRLSACVDMAVRPTIERHITWLDAEVDEAEWLLSEAVQASPAWRQKEEPLLLIIPGIGQVVGRTLLASLPELGATDGSRLAALVGLAPFAHDSGTLKGTRHIRGGRADARRALYLATLSVVRRDGPLKEFVERLRSRGK